MTHTRVFLWMATVGLVLGALVLMSRLAMAQSATVPAATAPATSPTTTPATTRAAELRKSEFRWPGATVTLEHSTDWKEGKTATGDHPVLLRPGPDGKGVSVAIEIMVDASKDRNIDHLLADRVRGDEEHGFKVTDKGVVDGKKMATIECITEGQAVDARVRETLIIEEDKYLIVREQIEARDWDIYQAQSAAVVGTVGFSAKRTEMVPWEVSGGGITVSMEHPSDWSHKKTATNHPFLVKTGETPQAILAGIEFNVMTGLKGRTLDQLLDQFAQGHDKDGNKILEKKVTEKDAEGTIIYTTATPDGLPMTARVTLLLVDADHLLIATATSPTPQWKAWGPIMDATVATVNVTIAPPTSMP